MNTRFLLLLVLKLSTCNYFLFSQKNDCVPGSLIFKSEKTEIVCHLDSILNKCFCGKIKNVRPLDPAYYPVHSRTLDRDLGSKIFSKSIATQGLNFTYLTESDSVYVIVQEFFFNKVKYIDKFNKAVKKRSDGVLRKPIYPLSFSWFVYDKSIVIYIYRSNRKKYFPEIEECSAKAVPPKSYGPR